MKTETPLSPQKQAALKRAKRRENASNAVKARWAKRRAAEADTELDAAEQTATAAAAPKKSKAIPQLEIWERRLVDPATRGSRSIALRQRGFELRYINTEVNGRYHEAIHTQGWIPVLVSDLADPNQIAGLFPNPEGHVRTGPGGIYWLVKMPTAVYDAIAKRKVELSRGKRQSKTAKREALMNRAAERDPRGPEAIANLKGEMTDLVERLDMDQEDLEPNLPTTDAEPSRTELT